MFVLYVLDYLCYLLENVGVVLMFWVIYFGCMFGLMFVFIFGVVVVFVVLVGVDMMDVVK